MARSPYRHGSDQEFADSIVAEAVRQAKIEARNDANFVAPPDTLSVVLAARSLVMQQPLPAPTPDTLGIVMASRVFLRGAVGGGSTGGQPLTFGTHLTGGSYDGSAPVTIGTDATAVNTPSTIVARDGSGNFAAGTVTLGKVQSTGTVGDPGEWHAQFSGIRTSIIYGTDDTGYGFSVIKNVAGVLTTLLTITDNGNLAILGSFSGTFAGNAATATKLATARTINGVSFDGTANITLPAGAAAAGTLTGTGLNTTVINSSLQSLGTLVALTLGVGVAPSYASTGTFKMAGTAVLVAGTVTIATSGISATGLVFLQRVSAGGAVGDLTYTKIAGTSITITSASGTDTSTVAWHIIETH